MGDSNTSNLNSNDQSGSLSGVPSPSAGGPNDTDIPRIRPWEINMLGVFLILFSILTGYLLYAFWPEEQLLDNKDKAWISTTYLFCWKDTECMISTELTADQRIIILVLLAGALGSFIHAATSFSNFVGQGKIEKSWIWWYLLRPVIGMGIALVFYFVFRGGLLNDTKIETLNIYGVMILSALSGLFTDRATLKLEEIFQALFKPEDNRKDKLNGNTSSVTDDNAQG